MQKFSVKPFSKGLWVKGETLMGCGAKPRHHEGSALDPLRELFEKSSLKTLKNF